MLQLTYPAEIKSFSQGHFEHTPTSMCRLQGASDMAATASWYQWEMSVSSNLSDELAQQVEAADTIFMKHVIT
jgi:hypothetical protein